ncbi:MAG: DNA polymerase III subunit delta [Flavobacteriaceae bacterium]|nr:DNA polymerase III subunit delta [Flavobacteriaceae bacterium]MDH3796613.1 DNA polymerase III subunit delta [Flavobacteriaceae bacterium]
MEEVKQIVSNIRQGIFHPIYFLFGDEPYFIDKIASYIGDNVLSEEERGFNQMILYGKDTSLDEVISNAKRYPMMAEKQVLIVREAQHLSRTIEQLVSYAEQPQESTLLVFCYKYKKLDKRKKLYKTLLGNNAILFESKKLYENQVSDWIRSFLKGKGYTITHKASVLLVEFLGTDLSRISNELEKLMLVLEKGSEISPEAIEYHIGFSKDFNNFELKKAIGERDILKASRIVRYFAQNPRENPFVVTLSLLHNFFSQLLQYHGLHDHNPKTVASALRINPYFVNEYQTAARNYSMRRSTEIVSALRELDLKGKGVGASQMSHSDLLKEMLAKIV